MPGQGNVKMPCGRSRYCGNPRCRHAVHCGSLSGGLAMKAGPELKNGAPPPPPKAAWAPAEECDTVYLYDGSLAGFFCCVFESVYGREMPAAVQPELEAQPTLYQQKLIETDAEKAGRVQKSIPAKLTPRAMELVEAVFLSCLPEKELRLLRFLRTAYKLGPQSLLMLGHPEVAPVLDAERHLHGEVHLLKGFVRFSDYDGVLAATITPKNFVLPYLAPHFAGRYPNERFLIYDKSHKAALVHEDRQPRIVPMEHIEFPEADETEKAYRALWKKFYNTIAIEARTNHKCRMTHMPKRYWENMLEVADLLH